MKILKYQVFDQDGFVEWQMEKERHINSVTPLVGSMKGNVSDAGGVDVNTHVSIFVLYLEEI